MAQFEYVYQELQNNTGTSPDIEEELCRRIAEIEDEDSIVPGLTKSDWILTWVLIALGTFLPIIYYAVKLGVSM